MSEDNQGYKRLGIKFLIKILDAGKKIFQMIPKLLVTLAKYLDKTVTDIGDELDEQDLSKFDELASFAGGAIVLFVGIILFIDPINLGFGIFSVFSVFNVEIVYIKAISVLLITPYVK